VDEDGPQSPGGSEVFFFSLLKEKNKEPSIAGRLRKLLRCLRSAGG
jgi:hypothetical protein